MSAKKDKPNATEGPSAPSIGAPQIVYTPRLEVDLEAEAWALASIYKRAIERSEQKKTAAEVHDEYGSEAESSGGWTK